MNSIVYMCAQEGDFVLLTRTNPIIHILRCEQNLLLKRKRKQIET